MQAYSSGQDLFISIENVLIALLQILQISGSPTDNK